MSDQKLTVSLILNNASFTKQLQDINKQVKLSESDFKRISSTTRNFGNTLTGAQGKVASLTRNIELQSKKTDLYKKAIADTEKQLAKLTEKHKQISQTLPTLKQRYEDTCRTMGKNSDEAKALKNEIEGLERQNVLLENRIVSTNGRLTSLNTELNRSETEFNRLTDEINDASRGLDNFDTEQAARRLNNLGDSLQRTGNKFKNIGSKVSSIGSTMTRYIAAPLIGVGIYAGKSAADFEQAMSKVKAVSQASSGDMKVLSDEAIKWGIKTKFSAKEAAGALGFMGQSGWKTQQMVKGLPGVLSLAAADNIELADASKIVTGALNGMGMGANQAGHFADVLATASAASNVNVMDMGETFKYAAPIAGMLGVNLEDLSVAISLMGNAGVQASQAGTALRSGMLRLVDPPKAAAEAMEKYNIEVKKNKDGQVNLAATMVNMRSKLGKLDETSRAAALSAIVGKNAVSGWAAVVSASDKDFSSLTQQINNSAGSAEKMASILQNNTKGKIENFMGSVETLGIKLGDTLLPILTDVIKKVQYWVDKFSALDESTQKNIVKMALWAVGLSVAVKGLGGMITGIGNTISAAGTLSRFLAGTTAATNAVAGAGAVAGGAGGLGALASGLGGVAAAAAPWLLGAAAVAGTGYAIYKAMNKEACPAVDLFADTVVKTSVKSGNAYEHMADTVQTETVKISDATKEAVGAYMQMDTDVKGILFDTQATSGVITDEIKNNLTTKFTEMGTLIKTNMKKDFDDNYGTLKDFFGKSTTLTDAEEAKTLKSTEDFYNTKKATVDGYEKQINDIISEASQKKRKLTDAECKTITELQNKMREEGIKTLSATEVEAKTILERIKSNDERLTAEQVSNHIKKAEEARQKSVSAAENECKKRVGAIIRMRDESKVISADQAKSLIDDAERQRKKTIDKADDMKEKVVNKISGMNKGIFSDVSKTTGKILTAWDKLKRWWNKWWPSSKTCKVNTVTSETHVKAAPKSILTSTPLTTRSSATFNKPFVNIPRMDKSVLRTMGKNIATFADNAYIPTVQDIAGNSIPMVKEKSSVDNQLNSLGNLMTASTMGNSNNETNNLLKEQNKLMMQLLNVMVNDRQTIVQLDGKAIAQSTDQYQGEMLRLKSRNLGLV